MDFDGPIPRRAVVYELVDDDPLTFRPVTAYDTPSPGAQKKRRKR
jgi:hypothetical protein